MSASFSTYIPASARRFRGKPGGVRTDALEIFIRVDGVQYRVKPIVKFLLAEFLNSHGVSPVSLRRSRDVIKVIQ